MVAVENQHVANFSADVSAVDEWLATRGVAFIPATSAVVICVKNEYLTTNSGRRTGHHAAQHGGSRLGFLADTGAPFMINAYPYFAYKENPSAVDLEYALLGNATRVHDPKGYIYNNMLDAQIDAIRLAINTLGFGNQTIEITVSESGWPSKGAPGDSTAMPDNAKKYNTWLQVAEFSEVVAAQLTLKTVASTPIRRETVAKLKVAINGFGRIGRNFLRCWHGRKDSPLDVVVVNDSDGVKNASHLLKYDSMLGTFKAEVKIVDDTTVSVDGKPIKGTGVFVDGSGAGKHIQAGAKKVIMTAPAKGADILTYVVGINKGDYSHEVSNIISNASCTTNCLAPFVKVMDEELGIVNGTMTTTHSYTGDQRLLDASHRDLRRARAAALNIVPTSTGAAKAVSLVLPQLKGKLNGIALCVPTPSVSVVDLVVNVEKKGITAEDVNAAFRKAAGGPLKGILAVCDAPLVQRVVDLAHLVARKWPGMPTAGSGDPLEDFCKTNPTDEECKVYEA
ncbi:hypothetical protein SLEP1_g41957 [Rubroshorea leprosula]|uniref:Glyceraldehyde 3-phosphate dehydrogenase NAD(P) binding domain-containing protein n=1 Tax=Rubroshorea leprosula TaxID=152421 RepID=A0AAV5L8B8_9ROSI|nr:hypothetical protein SLEP1_g41957 [Rubroshorea leprosula]